MFEEEDSDREEEEERGEIGQSWNDGTWGTLLSHKSCVLHLQCSLLSLESLLFTGPSLGVDKLGGLERTPGRMEDEGTDAELWCTFLF